MRIIKACALPILLLCVSHQGHSQIPQPTLKVPKTQIELTPCNVFSADLHGVRTPYGSGGRTIEICINKCTFGPTNIELVVFYSKTESQLGTVAINPAAAYGHGKAKYLTTVGNVLKFEYTFPHSGFTDINGAGAEFKIVEMPSRDANKNPQMVFFRIGAKSTGSNTIFATNATASFEMPDPITIGMVGDSYAAGEGAPIQDSNLFTDESQLWSDGDAETTTDVPCHRSYLSGQAQAAERVRRENKKLGIAIKHVSCSGAVVSELAQQQQNANGVNVPLQFNLIKNWLNNKGYSQLDVLLMGIGGNDAGFAQIVVDFMLNPFGNFHDDQDAKRRYSDPTHGEYPFNDLNQSYQQLNNDIWGGDFFNISVIGKPVIIQGYPSPCKGPSGSGNDPWCGNRLNDFLNPLDDEKVPGDCWGIVEGDDSPSEFQDMHNIVLAGLNSAVQKGASDNNWVFVNLKDRAGNHGMSNCAQPYFNTIGQSLSRQGNIFGMVHPNSNGYTNMFVDPLKGAIQGRIDEIRNYWKQFDAPSCSADERARIVELAKEAAKQKIRQKQEAAKAKAAKKPYPLIKSYTAYRSKYAKQVHDAAEDFKTQVKTGKIRLQSLPAIDPAVIKSIDFNDRFQK